MGTTSDRARLRLRVGNRFVSRPPKCHPERPRYGHGLCAPCYRVAHRTQRSGINRRLRLRKFYGLTEAQYDFLAAQQGGVCAICGEPEIRTIRGARTPLIVDHCHESGEVKGLLCYRCNLALGYFRERPALLRSAAGYLERFRERTA